MSVEWLHFVFIVLNMNVYVLGTPEKRRTNCSCVNFTWETFNFSFLPECEKNWKKRICSHITNDLEAENVSQRGTSKLSERVPFKVAGTYLYVRWLCF